MTQITIIGAPQSSFTWSTRVFAHERGVAYDLDPQPPHSEKVNAISPVGKIPVMRAGDVELAETRAICAWIDARADGPSLMPQSEEDEQWLSIFLSTVDKALVRDYALPYLFPRGEDGQVDRGKIDAALPMLERALSAADIAVSRGVVGGARWSLLDAVLVPMLFYANMYPEGNAGVEARPALRAYLAAQMARPGFAATVPSRPG